MTKPGAFSLTWIEFSPEDIEQEENARYGARIGAELMEMPGVITWMTAEIGGRWSTITAWEDVESLEKSMSRNQAHKEAMRRFFGTDFGRAVHTGVWVPHHIGPIWVRCSSCGRVSDYHRAEGTCQCGMALPPQPAYW